MRISVVVGQFEARLARLQPWRYIGELASGLARRGHEISIISDVAEERAARLEGCGYHVVPSVRTVGRGGTVLRRQLQQLRPDVVLWHVGLTSIAHTFPPRVAGARHVAVFTSPLYSPKDLWRIRRELRKTFVSYLLHIVGAAIPRPLVACYLRLLFEWTIALVPSTARKLSLLPGRDTRLAVIPPGRDGSLLAGPPAEVARTGSQGDEVTFLYAGNALPIRGAETLVRAVALARRAGAPARLVLLCRREQDEMARHERHLAQLTEELGIEGSTELVGGMLPREAFLSRMRQADVLALPFLLVPSEAPLLILEAGALEKPLITTAIAGIRDLAPPGSIITEPGNVAALAAAIAKVARDAELRARMATMARGWKATYPSWEQSIDRAEDLLASATPGTGL